MQASFTPVMRDYLVRFQQTAIKETGRRPMCCLREEMDKALIMPGCQRPGYVFWQPVSWPEDTAPMGEYGQWFHPSICDYLSMCQFMEIHFCLPVAPLGGKLNFLYRREFATFRNTVGASPARAFEEAAMYHREHPDIPLNYCMASTSDALPPLLMCLRAEDGQAFVQPADQSAAPLYLNVTVDRLLPKLQFVYDK